MKFVSTKIVLIMVNIGFFMHCGANTVVPVAPIDNGGRSGDANGSNASQQPNDANAGTDEETTFDSSYIRNVKTIQGCLSAGDTNSIYGSSIIENGDLEEESVRRCKYELLHESAILDILAEVKGRKASLLKNIRERCLDAKTSIAALEHSDPEKYAVILQSKAGSFFMGAGSDGGFSCDE